MMRREQLTAKYYGKYIRVSNVYSAGELCLPGTAVEVVLQVYDAAAATDRAKRKAQGALLSAYEWQCFHSRHNYSYMRLKKRTLIK